MSRSPLGFRRRRFFLLVGDVLLLGEFIVTLVANVHVRSGYDMVDCNHECGFESYDNELN